MTVLLAGCGDLGTEIGLRFAATGRAVVGLRRSPEKLPADITGIAVDLGREMPPVPADAEIVVMATSADESSEPAYRRAYRDALDHLLAGLDASGARPRRVLLVSSTGVYGAREGWVDEETAPEPGSATGAVLLETEQLLHQRVSGAVSLRLAGLYGPGRTRLLDQVRSGEAWGRGADRYTNRIHRDDAAAAVVHLTTRTEEPAPVYVGVDDEPAPRSAVLAFLADRLGVTPPDQHAATAGEPSGTPAGPTGKRCRNDRLVATGFDYRYPTYQEGYRAVLAGTGTRHP